MDELPRRFSRRRLKRRFEARLAARAGTGGPCVHAFPAGTDRVLRARSERWKKRRRALLVGAGDALPGEALPSVMKKAIEAALPGATRRRVGRKGSMSDIRHIVFDLGKS